MIEEFRSSSPGGGDAPCSLGMEGKLPHYTTLQKSSTRSNVLAIANALYLKKRGYGKRWHIEFFFSGLKRMMGSAFSSRTDANLLKEAAIRVLAYPLHR